MNHCCGKLSNYQAGFTLPELLVVIAVLVVLSIGAVCILRPASFDHENTLAERQTAVAQMVHILARYHAEKHAWPAGISAAAKSIGTEKGSLNLCGQLVPAYAKDIPIDPVGGIKLNTQTSDLTGATCAANTNYETGFQVRLSKDSAHVTVTAPALLGFEAVTITH